MASAPNPTPQGLPQQQQQAQMPANPASPSNNALQQLQGMLNGILINSGQYLKGQKHIEGLKRVIPATIDRYQDALDELESELYRAQVVLRRDLALRQAERREREQAAAAERQRLAAASSAKKTATPRKESPAQVEKVAASVTLDDAPQDSESSYRPDQQTERLSSKEEPLPPISTTDAPPRDPLFDPTPTTAHPKDSEFDFDAMFGESIEEPGEEADNEDKENNAGGDSAAQDLDFQAQSFSLDHPGPSLLPGLEDFANAKNSDDAASGQQEQNLDLDFPMSDLPDLSAKQPSDTATTAKPAEPPVAQPPAENADGGDNMQLDIMETDNLDELFSEFDNAFYDMDYGDN